MVVFKPNCAPINSVMMMTKSKNGLEELRMKETTGITDRLFDAPAAWKMALAIVPLSAIIGIMALFDLAALGSNFAPGELYSAAVIFGLVLIGLPAIIIGLIISPIILRLGGIFNPRRGMLLTFASVVIIFCVMLAAKLISYFVSFDIVMALFLSYAWVAAFQTAILLVLSNSSYARSIPPVLFHPVLGFAFIYFWSGSALNGYTLDSGKLLAAMVFIVIFVIITIIWIRVVAIPLKREFGLNGVDMARYGFEHFSDGDGHGMELESFFDSFGKRSNVNATVLAVRRRDATAASTKLNRSGNRRYKSVLIVPGLHKGPFGYLGGSNMPSKLKAELNAVSEHILVPHGAATHDLNPVSTAEVRRFARRIRSELEECKGERFHTGGSNFVRIGNGKGVTVGAQYIGDTVVGIFTAAPEPTDDIDARVGALAVKAMADADKPSARAKARSTSSPLFIDGHNSMEAGRGYIHWDSPQRDAIAAAAKNAVKLASESRKGSELRIGLAQKYDYEVQSAGLGPMGIQVMAVQTNDSFTTVYILFDGNNLERGLRGKILERLSGLDDVDAVEVLTTDNHIVNMTIGGYSPVGKKLEHEKLLLDLERLVGDALADLERVEVCSKKVTIGDLKIFGEGNTLRLSTTINNTVKLMGTSFVVGYGTALALALFVAKILI